MITKFYIKTYFRNLRKNPFFSLINIIGLAIGIAGFSLIMMYVQFEYSYDKFNSNYENIFRVEQDYAGRGQMIAIMQPAVGSRIAEDYPEVKNYTSFQALQPTTILSIKSDALLNEQQGWLANSSFFEVFDYKVIFGIKDTFLDEPFSIVLSESTAKKLFGSEDPIGKIVKWDERFNCKVTGIVEDCPANSHIEYRFFISYTSMLDERLEGEKFFKSWNTFQSMVYLVLDPNTDIKQFGDKIYDLFRVHIAQDYPSNVHIKALSQLHFYSNVLGELGPRGDIKKVFVLIAIAILLLLIAIANFINLSTARAGKRSKEIGLKKVVGAVKFQLIKQFFFESFITIILALVISFLLIYLVLPEFSVMVERDLKLNQISYISASLFVILIVISTTVLSGFYPALVMSSFSPLEILKSEPNSGRGFAAILRNALVIFQFTISIILIISTLLINKQTQFLKNTDLGFEKENIFNTAFRVHELSILEKQFNLKSELLQNPQIENISISNYIPGFNGRSFSTGWEGSEEGESVHIYRNDIDLDYTKMFGVEIVEGRSFIQEDFNDTIQYCLINESAKKHFSWDEAVGKRVGPNYQVVGVMKDFHFASLKEKIQPLIYFPIINNREVGRTLRMSVRYNPENEKDVKEFLEEKYTSFFPNDVCEFWSFNSNYRRSFREEENTMKTTAYFSGLAIFIACIGLFGLTTFIIQSKNKEIGIRKVFGASSTLIVKYLLKTFIKWLFIANIIAIPITYYYMSDWLSTFPYHTTMSVWEFVIGSFAILFIALLTVSVQSYQASIKNPVKTLRYE